jgi:hypothetical protein
MRTIFPCKTGVSKIVCTEFAQLNPRTPDRRVRFPVTIRHRTSKAKIYAPSGNFSYYRLAYTTAGKRRMQTFANYPAAKVAAERLVRDAANGSPAATFSATQSRDATTAFEMLEDFRQKTGRRISLPAAISEFIEAAQKLGERTLREAADGFIKTVACGCFAVIRSVRAENSYGCPGFRRRANNQSRYPSSAAANQTENCHTAGRGRSFSKWRV